MTAMRPVEHRKARCGPPPLGYCRSISHGRTFHSLVTVCPTPRLDIARTITACSRARAVLIANAKARHAPMRDGRTRASEDMTQSGARLALTSSTHIRRAHTATRLQPSSTMWSRTRATRLCSGIDRTGNPSASAATTTRPRRRTARSSRDRGGGVKVMVGAVDRHGRRLPDRPGLSNFKGV